MSNIKFSSGVDVYTIMQRLIFWVRGTLIWVVEMMKQHITKSNKEARIGIYLKDKDLNSKRKMKIYKRLTRLWT